MNLPVGYKLKDFTILREETRSNHIYCARTDESFHVDSATFAEVFNAHKKAKAEAAKVEAETQTETDKNDEEGEQERDDVDVDLSQLDMSGVENASE